MRDGGTRLVAGTLVLWVGLSGEGAGSAAQPFQVELFEDLAEGWRNAWSFEGMSPAMSWTRLILGITRVPGKLSPAGLTMHRIRPFAVRIQGTTDLPAGEYEFTLRSRMYARLV